MDKVNKSEDKLVAYKLLDSLGENMTAGTIVHLAESKGQALVDAGLAELAAEDDMGGEPAEEEVITNAADKLLNVVQKGLAETADKLLKSAPKETVPATVKQPAFRSNGDAIKAIVKSVWNGDKSEANRLQAWQQETAQMYNDLGLVVKAPLGINEGTNSQGGYLVNPEYSKDVYAIPHGQINLQEQCENIDAKSNVYNQRFVNESSLANGSIFGGLNMVATSEGSNLSSSLPAWSNVTFTLSKLTVFNYYTAEVLQDASYPLESELNEYVNKAFVYGINSQILQGSTLEGLLNSPSCVTITSSSHDTSWSSTPATCLTYADLASIWASVYPDCQTSPKGMWLFHPSLTNPLVQLSYTWGGSSPAWGIQFDARETFGEGSGFPGTPYRIFGKPAYPTFACSAPGSAGDIMYVDFNTVKSYAKPFRVEVSKEFVFGSDQVAVKYISRLDIKSIFRNKVTGSTGSQQFSNIVTRTSVGT